MELERVKADKVEHMSEKDAMEEDLKKKVTDIIELKNTLKHFEVKAGDPEIEKLKHDNKEILFKIENSRPQIKNTILACYRWDIHPRKQTCTKLSVHY